MRVRLLVSSLLLLSPSAVAAAPASPPQEPAPLPVADAAALRAAYAKPPAEWPAPTIDAGVAFVELGRVTRQPAPTDAQGKAKVELGRALFFDGRLSGTQEMACASCHDADLAWADGRTTSFGHGFKPLRRNAPSILNAASMPSLFWDGRAKSLQDQALMVFTNAEEMATEAKEIERKLGTSKGYRERFAEAFGDDEPRIERVLEALAAFERTIQSDGSSAFDRFLGGDHEAMSDEEIRGLHLFRTKARCANCHHGPLLTDHGFHDLGLSYYGRDLEDLGRVRVTKDPGDTGRFRTPSLRNVTRTAPYMHNGLFDLPGVINMYSAGMVTLKPKDAQKDDPAFPKKSPLLQKLDLTASEKEDLLAFLGALEERRRRMRPPQLPPFGTH